MLTNLPIKRVTNNIFIDERMILDSEKKNCNFSIDYDVHASINIWCNISYNLIHIILPTSILHITIYISKSFLQTMILNNILIQQIIE